MCPCSRLESRCRTPSHSGSDPPEDTALCIWILAPNSELKGYLRLGQLLLIW